MALPRRLSDTYFEPPHSFSLNQAPTTTPSLVNICFPFYPISVELDFDLHSEICSTSAFRSAANSNLHSQKFHQHALFVPPDSDLHSQSLQHKLSIQPTIASSKWCLGRKARMPRSSVWRQPSKISVETIRLEELYFENFCKMLMMQVRRKWCVTFASHIDSKLIASHSVSFSTKTPISLGILLKISFILS